MNLNTQTATAAKMKENCQYHFQTISVVCGLDIQWITEFSFCGESSALQKWSVRRTSK